MGYYTTYNLKTEPETPEAIAAVVEASGYGHYLFEGEPCKWYGNEVDMRGVSAVYPDVLFTLTGIDEETRIWAKHFKGGKMQFAMAHIAYEPFDEKELK